EGGGARDAYHRCGACARMARPAAAGSEEVSRSGRADSDSDAGSLLCALCRDEYGPALSDTRGYSDNSGLDSLRSRHRAREEPRGRSFDEPRSEIHRRDRVIVRLESTASTMIDAAALAARGEPHGTVVVAERQTAGIGRQGHSWHSEARAGLYLSIVLRLRLAPSDMPALTMALGLAVQAAVNECADVA